MVLEALCWASWMYQVPLKEEPPGLMTWAGVFVAAVVGWWWRERDGWPRCRSRVSSRLVLSCVVLSLSAVDCFSEAPSPHAIHQLEGKRRVIATQCGVRENHPRPSDSSSPWQLSLTSSVALDDLKTKRELTPSPQTATISQQKQHRHDNSHPPRLRKDHTCGACHSLPPFLPSTWHPDQKARCKKSE